MSAERLVAQARREMELFDDDGYNEAVRILRSVLEVHPACAPAYAALAESYAYWAFRHEISGLDSAGFYALSFEFAETALKLAPERADSHRAAAVAMRRGPHRDDERSCAESVRACELDPDDALNWAELWRVGGYRLEDPALAKALEFSGPALCGLYIDLGAVYSNMGRDEDALVELTRALRINPRNKLALYDLAVVLERTGRHEKGLAVIGRAKQMHPADPLIEKGLALLK